MKKVISKKKEYITISIFLLLCSFSSLKESFSDKFMLIFTIIALIGSVLYFIESKKI